MSGMTSVLTQVNLILENTFYDVIVLTETWLRPHHLDLEIASSLWNITRFDRPNDGKGGGVLIAVKTSLSCSTINLDLSGLNTFTSQQCWMKIILNNKDVYIGDFYLRKNQSTEDYIAFIQRSMALLDGIKDEDICFIFGDFNLSNLCWGKIDPDDCYYAPSNITTELEENVLQMFADRGFGQICDLSNNSGNVLDLVYTNAIDNFELSEVDSIFGKTSVHHRCIAVNFLYAYRKLPDTVSNKIIHDFEHADYDSIFEFLRNTDVSSEATVDEIADDFEKRLLLAIDTYVPKKIVMTRNKAPWHDSTYFRLKNRRNRDYTRWKKSNSDELKLIFLKSRSDLDTYDAQAYENYVRNSANAIKSQPKKFWKCLDHKRQIRGYPNSMSYKNVFVNDSHNICNSFKEFFATVYEEDHFVDTAMNEHIQLDEYLTDFTISRDVLLLELKNLDANKGPGPDGIHAAFLKKTADVIVDPLLNIFNMSLNKGYFPKNWRSSIVVPIFKSGDRSKIENYRGIAILNTIAKLFEKIVADHLAKFLSRKIDVHQHGFRAGHSTSSNLCQYASNLLLSLENNKQVDAIYTDFSKAFDKVNHKLLRRKLVKIGVRGKILDWIYTYLSNRTQKVRLNGVFSDSLAVTSGVPQGSHLGPILFIIFINDLSQHILNCHYLLYADDMKIYKIVNETSDTQLIQDDLNRINTWCTKNLMFLNVSKCNTITFTKKRKENIIASDYYINDVSLKRVQSVNDLGVTFDYKINFNSHVDKIVNESRRVLGFIKRRAKEFKDPFVTKILYQSLVRSKLEYASVAWNTSGATKSSKIESIQKQFLLFALKNLGWRRDTYALPAYTDRLKLLNMETLEQ
ncbi:uncharacterized protein LOC134836418, partial [Culicoides brevitarsis]|uniref:uncharacterized protein LOC134836418 n=1 Tax=Culicoides brevitarsis TaxID=469753 RepID=UPI00307B228F